MIIVYSIILISSLIIAGYYNAIMDCIAWHDSIKNKWGEYWSRDFSTSNKDRNLDGKISYWEKTLPQDGWHESKRNMTSSFKTAMLCSILLGSELSKLTTNIFILCLCILIPTIYLLFGASFSFFYSKYKKI